MPNSIRTMGMVSFLVVGILDLQSISSQEITSRELGRAIEKQVEHGSYVQYVPRSVTPRSKMLVVCHGVFSNGDAIQAATNCLDDWHRFAEEHSLVAIAPAFDNENFACSIAGALGGYRTLTGRQIGADDFLHEIIQVYQDINPDYDGRFLLFGHSAGGQFANRYVVTHPERVIGALISSPAWFAFPDPDERWPYGMQPRRGNFLWGNTGERVLIDVTPDAEDWLLANRIPTMVIVGELDTVELKDTGKTHVTQATEWVEKMNELAETNGEASLIQLNIVPRIEHNYGQLVRAGIPFLADVLQNQ